jgi:hypothetical protein
VPYPLAGIHGDAGHEIAATESAEIFFPEPMPTMAQPRDVVLT